MTTTMVNGPDRCLQQRLEALRRANDIRSRRAQLKRDLKARRQMIAPLLVDPPDYLETARLYELLLALPRYGRVKATKVLSRARVSHSKTLGGLSERQRLEVLSLLGGGRAVSGRRVR